MTKVRDSVCGMEFDERFTVARSEYSGEQFYFCSEECKEKFDKNPEAYRGSETS